MFIEQWIHQQIGGASNPEDFQLLKLEGILDYVYKSSPFYRDLFNEKGIKPANIRTLEDLALVPFTHPEKLREEPNKFLCVSLSKVKRIFTLYTGGTTGIPKQVFFSEKDLERITDYMGAAMKSVAEDGGISNPGFKVHILLPNGKPESQLKLLARGLEKVGATPILGDVSLDARSQIEAIKESKPDILFGSTSKIYRITQETKGDYDLNKLGVKIVFVTSEYVPASMRERLRDTWEAEIFTHFGMTEMGFAGGIECKAHDVYHFNEADFLLEVVDPETGAVLRNGEEGQLVLTTLNREAMPLIRYRTNDLCRITSGACGCGATRLKKIDKTIRRIESLVKLKVGEVIYPSIFEDILYRMPNIINYDVFLTHEGDKERIEVVVEVTAEWPKAREEVTEAVLSIPSIVRSIEADLMAKPEIQLREQGTMKRVGRVKKLIIEKN